jgi:hypothetical protein
MDEDLDLVVISLRLVVVAVLQKHTLSVSSVGRNVDRLVNR